MDTEQKAKAPADFELVLGQGIHPFYLDMSADQVFEAAVGWKVLSVEREDADCIHFQFQTRRKSIEVCLINTFWLEPGAKSHYRVYCIHTEDLQFSDGKRLSGMKKENVLPRFTGENALVRDKHLSDDDEDDWYSAYYDSMNQEIHLIFNRYDKSSFSISRNPEFGYGQDYG